MGISRRTALKTLIAAGGASLASAATAHAAGAEAKLKCAHCHAPPDAVGLLYDSTRCIGCKACMVACNKANDLPPDTRLSDGRWQMPTDLNEYTKNIIKVYQDPDTGESAFIKRQCMHCIDPACTNACMLGALKKRERGIVTYDADLCVGCRYCAMACPFNIPKFEWEKLASKIVKCELCNHRIAEGKRPACTEVCPTAAVVYGTRHELLDEARARLAAEPDRYVPKVYGETDAGGTQVLYLSHVDFTKLGLPDIGEDSVPEPVRAVQQAVYRGFIAPVVLYAVLASVAIRNRRHPHLPENDAGGGGNAGTRNKESRS